MVTPWERMIKEMGQRSFQNRQTRPGEKRWFRLGTSHRGICCGPKKMNDFMVRERDIQNKIKQNAGLMIIMTWRTGYHLGKIEWQVK